MKVTQGQIPESQILKANFPEDEIMTGQFPSRYVKRIYTGVHVEASPGFKVCIQLVPELCEKGMVAANAPGYFSDGEIYVDLVNAGKEIVTLKRDDPLCKVYAQGMFSEEAFE